MPRWLPRAGWGLRGVLMFALLGLLAGCSNAGRSSSGTTVPTDVEASVYFLTGAQGWPVAKQAYKPRPDNPITSRTEPTLDWYAEHERFPDPSRSEAVRLSGHDVPVGQLEDALAGFSLHRRQVRSLQARAGTGPDGPRVVLLPVAPSYTVMTLSYELSLDELVEWTNALKAVDEAGWVAAGGVIAK
jgi:hypothetical protein